jgi:YVTN family beta-propeller protein
MRRHFKPLVILGWWVTAVVFASPTWAQFAYVANFGDGTVSIIDLTTETEVSTLTVGGDPYWVAVGGGIVAVSLHDSTGVALIDTATNSLLGIVGGVGSEPEAVAVNSSGSTVYVADESGDELYVVNVGTQTVTAGPIALTNCSEPENMVISPNDAFLYITCADGSNSSVIRVATSGFAQLTIDDMGLNDAHGIALSPDGTLLYYTDGTDSFAWNTGTQMLTGTTFLGCDMYGGAVSPDGTRLYCVEESNTVKIYNTATGALVFDVNLGTSNATAVAPNALGTRIYVPISSADAVEVVDPATGTNLAGNIPVSGVFPQPRGIAIAGAPIIPIPTLPQWGMILLTLSLLTIATWQLAGRPVLVGMGRSGQAAVLPDRRRWLSALLGGQGVATLGLLVYAVVVGPLVPHDGVGALLSGVLIAVMIECYRRGRSL